ncbi:MAG: S8 family serine peptidase [Planctomycetota bacterium]
MPRRPCIESLEGRRLLAGDLSGCDDPTIVVGAAVPGQVSAMDAGSTPATAADIGSIDGTRRLAGTLGWYDSADTIRFSVERDATVRLELSGLRRDADLYLSDSQGNLIASSTEGGRNSEVLAGRLRSGDYYLTVVARSFWSNRYQLTLTADLDDADAMPDIPVPVPTPAPDPQVSAPEEPVLATPQPLADVAYFGGSREWNVNAVGAPESWSAGYTGAGVTVAVVDTGVDLDHPDLVHSLYVNPGEIAGNGIDDDGNGYIDDVNGYDFADDDPHADDVSGHGTHVAGTIAAANNGFGATGVAPEATILPVRVLGADGSGSTLDVAAGIRYAADLGADIINLSLGGGYSQAIESAIEYAKSVGSLIVAAAGNESAAAPAYPARFSSSDSNVISVGASTSSDRIASFSNDVGASGAVQVDAPGAGVYSTYVGGQYATLSGTSMAAPHVAGVAALALSANPDLTSPQLRDLLTSGTVGNASGSDAIGLINAATSVAYAAAGVTTPVNASVAPTSVATTRGSVAASATQVAVATPLDLEQESPEDREVVVTQAADPIDSVKRLVASPNGPPPTADPGSVDEAIQRVMEERESDDADLIGWLGQGRRVDLGLV